MNKLSFLGAIAAVILLSAFTIQSSVNWAIQDGYSITFTSDDPSGVFTQMAGEIAFDPDNLGASQFDVKVDVASINTGNGMKNKHAKGAKWFDAETYPHITFKSKKFAKTSTGYEVVGTLEMHGVAKEFAMPFTFENNTFRSSLTVNRLEFGVGTMKGMSKKVPADLAVEISVPVAKK